jgi:hypothetical protein
MKIVQYVEKYHLNAYLSTGMMMVKMGLRITLFELDIEERKTNQNGGNCTTKNRIVLIHDHGNTL